MKVKKTLTEILKDQTITNQFTFTGSCPDKDGVSQTFTIFDTNFFLNEIEHNYFNRVAFVDKDNSFTDLTTMFSRWAASRGRMFAGMAYAYTLGYNPIENYSSIETHTGYDQLVNGKKITHTWSSDTITREYDALNPLKQSREYDALDPYQQTREYDAQNPYKTATTHENDKEEISFTNRKDTNKSYKFGVNSSNKVQQSETEDGKDGKETTEFLGTRNETTSGKYWDKTTGKYYDTTTGKYTDTHSGSYDDSNSGTDKTEYNSTLSKSGNIGIQTAADMKKSEYNNLSQDLALRALWDFLDRFTFYSEGVDDIWW